GTYGYLQDWLPFLRCIPSCPKGPIVFSMPTPSPTPAGDYDGNQPQNIGDDCSSCGSSPPPPSTADPIYLSNRKLFVNESDVHLDSGLIPLEFNRRYLVSPASWTAQRVPVPGGYKRNLDDYLIERNCDSETILICHAYYTQDCHGYPLTAYW